LFFGWLADRFQLRGSLLRFACVTSLIPFSVLSLLTLLGVDVGFAGAFVVVAAFSLFRIPMMTIADVTALERPQNFGALRLWGSLGFLFAALPVGLWMSDWHSVAFPLTISLTLVAALVVAWRLPRRAEPVVHSASGSFRELLGRRDFRLMFGIWILWAVSHVAYDLCFSLRLRDLGAKPFDVSVAWSMGTLAEVAIMALCAFMLPKASYATWTFIGMLGTALRWLLIAKVHSLTVLLLLQPLHALSFALLWMTWLDFIKQNAPAHLLARAQGTLSTVVSIGATAGILLWGPLYSSQGASFVFQSAAGFAAVACLISLVPLLKQRSRFWTNTSNPTENIGLM
jgi:PPP family 3-phenylpropionic acid transporter